jgi:hypothetical protein
MIIQIQKDGYELNQLSLKPDKLNQKHDVLLKSKN